MKIFDFRTTGLNIVDSGLTDGQDKYVAGTHFNDAFTGENNVNNLYYYVGLNGTANVPSDTFHGGTVTIPGDSSWNVAVFPDSRANYTIQQQAGGFLIKNVGDSAHAGSVTVDSNVQALAFDPTHDPLPHSDGSLEATGDTLTILTNFTNAATIDAGAALEFVASDSGAVTFADPTGKLILDQPSNFTGQIFGFTGDGTLSGSDQIDLAGINSTSGSFTHSYLNGILTVSDGTHTANLHFMGSYSPGNFHFVSDGAGGTIVYDPPTSTSTQDTNSPVTADDGANAGETGGTWVVDPPTGPESASGTFVFKDLGSAEAQTLTVSPKNADASYVGNFTIDAPNKSNGQETVDWHFNVDQATIKQTVTQTYNVAVIDDHPDGTKTTTTQALSITIGGQGNDTFVFKPGFGANTIVNAQTNDIIELDGFSSVTSTDQVQAYLSAAANNQAQPLFQATNNGHDTVINLGNNDVVTLANVQLTDLHTSNFIIHT